MISFFIILFLALINFGQCQQFACENRNPEGHSAKKRSGDGTFELEIVGKEANNRNYVPNEVYTVTIKGLKTRYNTKKFLEFLLVAESEKMAMMGGSGIITTGIFHIVDEGLSRFSDVCPDGVTNSNLRPKSEISVLWTAPSVLVASCITFKATIVERPHIWYMDEGGLSKTLCPYTPPPPSTTTTPRPVISQQPIRSREVSPKCCACDEAKYDVAFEGIWSKETHPKDFPENKWLLHFSDIIGASHSDQFYFWETEKLATEGIRHVAEWGATRVLENELKAKSRHINTIIKARGLWHPNERGQTSAAFRVDRSRHLMSLVTMLGPSPDWFVGVSGYDLCTPNCTWLEEAHFNLYPYDAGTDSGISYMSPNEPTSPPQVIRRLSETKPNDTRSPFYSSGKQPMEPLAKLHLNRQRIYPKSCSNTDLSPTEDHEIVVSENTEDVGRPECAVDEWSSWSDCSVTCGKGLRMRKRSYLIPFKADMFRCDRQLEEKEMCLGMAPICENEEESNEDDDSICAVTKWSEWTPCDRQCGKGTRFQNRRYKNHMGRKRCNLEMTQTEDCMGKDEACEIENVDPECPVTPWSEYTPCSVNCGPGFRERTRFFLLSLDSPVPPKCLNVELTQNVSCTGEYGSCEITLEEAKNICMLEADEGPCRFWKHTYSYNTQKGICVPIRYGGCKGNRNRFETEMECIKACGFLNPQLNLSSQTPDLSSPDIISNISSQSSEEISTSIPTTPATTTTKDIPILDLQNSTEAQVENSDFVDDGDFAMEEEDTEPVDCVVSKFSDWSPCVGEFGELGYMTRSRDIIIEPKDGKYKAAKKCPRHLKKRRVCRVKSYQYFER